MLQHVADNWEPTKLQRIHSQNYATIKSCKPTGAQSRNCVQYPTLINKGEWSVWKPL